MRRKRYANPNIYAVTIGYILKLTPSVKNSDSKGGQGLGWA